MTTNLQFILLVICLIGIWLAPFIAQLFTRFAPNYKRLQQQRDHWKSLYIQERSERLRLEWMLNEHGERWKTE